MPKKSHKKQTKKVKSKKPMKSKSKLFTDVNKMLLTKDKIKGMLLFDPNSKVMMKNILDKLPDDKDSIENEFDLVFNKIKSHYTPLIVEFKKDKNLFN
tara:strand:+ start:2471 stop:2764 length:294 start_codon:yes stop_codon:yes gene_type:complete